jgi:pectin methylesterase-like acyl-CoA thioesterase
MPSKTTPSSTLSQRLARGDAEDLDPATYFASLEHDWAGGGRSVRQGPVPRVEARAAATAGDHESIQRALTEQAASVAAAIVGYPGARRGRADG